MKKPILLFIFCLILFRLSGQKIISGVIINNDNKEAIIGANIRDISNKSGCVSNNYGFFSIKTYQLPDTIIISYIGYRTDTIIVDETHLNLSVALEEKVSDIDVFEVVGTPSLISSTSTGVVKISPKQIKQLPTLGGESDAIKAFQLMPGVQSGNEGTSSLLVRGGTPDQTLTIMDDVPIYYLNHIGGFLSTIDVNTINSIKLIKGGFPAEYGNRLSGILDIRLKNGNKSNRKLSLALGLVSTKVFAEGPIDKKGKTTYMLSLRRCNFDLLTRLYFNWKKETYVAGYTFYDGYAKITHEFNPKNAISISIYNGRDKIFNDSEIPDIYDPDFYHYEGSMKVKWGNTLVSAKYNHQFSNKLFGSTTIGYSKFNYSNSLENLYVQTNSNVVADRIFQSYNSGINDFLAKQDFDYYVSDKLKIKAGASLTNHIFNLGLIESVKSRNDGEISNNIMNSYEIDVYEQNEIKLKYKIRMNIGIHYNQYLIQQKSYYSFQPRFNISKAFNKTNSIKMSFSVMQQNMHLLSNNGAGVPVDLWVPATTKILPQNSNQLSIGYYKIFGSNNYEFSTELYYKSLNNQIDYKEGVNLFSKGADWESKIETGGIGKSTGLEFLLQKKYGKLTGWLAYTLSYNYRKFTHINDGQWYPYKFDRRHVFTMVANYSLTKHISLSSDFVFMTGNAITLPVGQYPTYIYSNSSQSFMPNATYIYNGRNASRMPNYHRLDLSINFKKNLKRGSREWVVSIYNVYSHQNVYYLYLQEDRNNKVHLYQITLFPIIPSVLFRRNF